MINVMYNIMINSVFMSHGGMVSGSQGEIRVIAL